MSQDPCIMVTECDMIDMSAFTPELNLAFSSMPEEIMASYVRDKCIEFCEKTSVVKQQIPIDLQCNVSDYFVDARCGMRVVAIQKLCAGGDLGNEGAWYDLKTSQACRFGSICGTSSAWFVPPSSIHLGPAPKSDRAGALFVLASVAPDRDACEVPTELYQRYHDEIIAGVKSQLYLLKGMDTYDQSLATNFAKQWKAGLDAANINRLLGYTRGPIVARPRFRFV